MKKQKSQTEITMYFHKVTPSVPASPPPHPPSTPLPPVPAETARPPRPLAPPPPHLLNMKTTRRETFAMTHLIVDNHHGVRLINLSVVYVRVCVEI